MGDKGPPCPKGETKTKITQEHLASPSNGGKGHNKHNWGQGEPRLHNDKEKLQGKGPLAKNVRQDLTKVKCFNHGHLAKDYPKSP